MTLVLPPQVFFSKWPKLRGPINHQAPQFHRSWIRVVTLVGISRCTLWLLTDKIMIFLFFSISQKMEDTLCIWHCSLVVKSLYWSFEIRSMQCLIIRLTYSPVLGDINNKYFSQTYPIIYNRVIYCMKSKWWLWIQQTKAKLFKKHYSSSSLFLI